MNYADPLFTLNGADVETLHIFAPGDVERLFAQEEAIERGYLRHLETPEWRYDVKKSSEPRYGDADLDQYIAGCRNALRLPLGDRMRLFIAMQLGYAEAEGQARAARKRKYGDKPRWEDFDLLGAVREATGESGTKKGANWWFRCPWHQDKNPSLEVQPEKRLWHCWAGCGAGGVREWQQRCAS